MSILKPKEVSEILNVSPQEEMIQDVSKHNSLFQLSNIRVEEL